MSHLLTEGTGREQNIDSSAQISSWRNLFDNEYSPVVISEQVTIAPVQSRGLYGIAIDLGTTQIRVSLWNIENKQRLAGCIGLNPQGQFGVDVLSRLMAASASKDRAWELGWLAKSAISEALQYIFAETEYDIRDVGQVVIVGNTAMLCLLSEKNYDLLLQPEYWTREIDCKPKDTTSWKAAWGIDINADVEVVSSLAGFIGSDFFASVLATRLLESPAGSLIIDFGTNSEIGLWDGVSLWVTSAPGGPAFEGSGISCGLPAEPGAIFKAEKAVYAGKTSDEFLYEVIGDVEAKGICGSGLVDVIADLVRTGALDRIGKFTHKFGGEGVPILKGAGGGQKKINLNERDIDTFQRAKSAVAAGTVCLLKRAGIQSKDLKRIYICGAFGRFLNIVHAQEIGLLPLISPQWVDLYGNATLAGCESLLLSRDRSAILNSIRAKTNIFNLAQLPEFEERFFEGLFLQPMQKGLTGTEGSNREEAA